jgi:hypothetical protein
MAEDGKKTGPETAPEASIEDLARRLMDLWQEQMAAIAADPDLMRQMAQMMAASPFPAMMQGIMQGILAANAKSPMGPGGQNPYEWWKADGPKPSTETQSTQTGAPAAAPASQPGGGDLAELRRNLAGLEARLAELGGSPGTAERAREPAAQPAKPKRPARKSPKPVAGPAGGSGESGTGGAGGGAAG